MQQDPSLSPAAAPPVAPVPGAGGNAAAMQAMGFQDLIQNFDALGWIVFITLCVMSVMSVYYIVFNYLRNSMVRRRMERIIHTFWDTPSAQDAVRFLEEQPKNEPFSKIALAAAGAAAHHQRNEGSRLVEALNRSEFIDRALRQSVAHESLRLEGGMTLLATVGSAAPFVGLLGTVWGIYHALIKIAASGNASMEAVAGPVGEALIMTAFGLFVAIPAVLGFNFYVRQNRVIFARFDEFAHDLHDFFATGSRVDNGVANVAARK